MNEMHKEHLDAIRQEIKAYIYAVKVFTLFQIMAFIMICWNGTIIYLNHITTWGHCIWLNAGIFCFTASHYACRNGNREIAMKKQFLAFKENFYLQLWEKSRFI
jgi:hypothetical protein